MRNRVLIAHACAILFSVATTAPSARGQAPADGDSTAAADRRFEEFVRRSAGSVIGDVAVESERHIKVKLRDSVSPEETLPLTKGLMAGARKDFPGQLITVAVYDPAGHPILRARFRPGHGVDYEVVHGDGHASGPRVAVEPTPGRSPSPPASASALPRSGQTEKDRKFAAWAEQKGHDYLRYVEADLENHGRLWFGVTRAVKPADVPALTKSLLEGAHAEFPRRELVATVFDPEGEKIGRAVLGSDGQIHWSR